MPGRFLGSVISGGGARSAKVGWGGVNNNDKNDANKTVCCSCADPERVTLSTSTQRQHFHMTHYTVSLCPMAVQLGNLLVGSAMRGVGRSSTATTLHFHPPGLAILWCEVSSFSFISVQNGTSCSQHKSNSWKQLCKQNAFGAHAKSATMHRHNRRNQVFLAAFHIQLASSSKPGRASMIAESAWCKGNPCLLAPHASSQNDCLGGKAQHRSRMNPRRGPKTWDSVSSSQTPTFGVRICARASCVHEASNLKTQT